MMSAAISYGNTADVPLPVCYNHPSPVADDVLRTASQKERNLYTSRFAVSGAEGFSAAEKTFEGLRPSNGWQKARFTEECDEIFVGNTPSPSSPRPPRFTFTGRSASTIGGSCFLMEAPTESVTDAGNEVGLGNVRCFGLLVFGPSPAGIYRSVDSSFQSRIPTGGFGPVPIAEYAGAEFATRTATQIVAGSYHYCVLYRPETVGSITYTDSRVVCWGLDSSVQGLGLGVDANEQPRSVDLLQPATYRTFVAQADGTLAPGAQFVQQEAKPRDIPMNDGDDVIELISLQSAVCARIINEGITGSDYIVLLRCWGDWDNLKAAGLLSEDLNDDIYEDRNQVGTMENGKDGPPYLWLGRGWGYTAEQFSQMQASGYSIAAFGASIDGLPLPGAQTGKIFNAGSASQVACFAAEDPEEKRVGLCCVSELSATTDNLPGSIDGLQTTFGPTADSVSTEDFLLFIDTSEGDQGLVVHDIAVTAS